MTKYERWAVVLSIAAVLASVATPVFMHLRYNPVLEEQRNAGRIVYMDSWLYDNTERPTGYRMVVDNVGKRSVSDLAIHVAAIEDDVKLPASEADVLVVPIAPVSFSRGNNRVHVKIDRVLAPGERLFVSLHGLGFPSGTDETDLIVDLTSSSGGASWRGSATDG